MASYFEPKIAEVVAAAHSLYDDELKPFGRILLKRIRERAAERSPARFADAESVPLVDPRFLRRLCERSRLFHIEPAEGREYAVLLPGRPAVFVDATCQVDPYPARLWAEAAAYFDTLEGEDSRLPCGRYACAQVLRARSLPFLSQRSLGEVCHIVQLAMSQKKILGYLDGHTVPYCASEECAKQRCAVRQQPFGEAPVQVAEAHATWDDLRRGLRLILETSCNPAPGVITLSNVKRLFRSQLGLEVSETVLGHARVCDLLQDARLQDICTVQVLGCGQSLVSLASPLVGAAAQGARGAFPLCTAPPAAAAAGASSCASTRTPTASCTFAGAVQMMPMAATWGCAVQVPLLAPKVLPCWDASTTVSYAESETDAGWTSGASDDLETNACSDCGEPTEAELNDIEAMPADLAGASFVVRNTFIDFPSPVATAAKRSRSLPRSWQLA